MHKSNKDILSMIFYLSKYGELHFDCMQMIFNSDTINEPEGIQLIYNTSDKNSYRIAITECVSTIKLMQSDTK